jgi:hypothetical protein
VERELAPLGWSATLINPRTLQPPNSIRSPAAGAGCAEVPCVGVDFEVIIPRNIPLEQVMLPLLPQDSLADPSCVSVNVTSASSDLNSGAAKADGVPAAAKARVTIIATPSTLRCLIPLSFRPWHNVRRLPQYPPTETMSSGPPFAQCRLTSFNR